MDLFRRMPWSAMHYRSSSRPSLDSRRCAGRRCWRRAQARATSSRAAGRDRQGDLLEADGATPRLFYYRKTTVGVPPTSSYSFDGLMGDMYKVRFEIQARSTSSAIARSTTRPARRTRSTGGDNNTDTPFLIFKIASHFDIKREYNPATGEETNVISREHDRPAVERAPVHARRLVARTWPRGRRPDGDRSDVLRSCSAHRAGHRLHDR